jgi:hypothetical protein
MPDSGWVPVANTFIQNHSLSWRAKGLLAELLSYPDGWDTSVDRLVELGKRDGGNAEGRYAMHAAMTELVAAGYARHVRTRGERGQWTTSLTVSDALLPNLPTADCPQSEEPESADRESADRQSVGRESDSREVSTKTEHNTITKTDLERSSEQHSASLASLAAAADAAADDDSIPEIYGKVYNQIDNLTEHERRQHLLVVERRRPRIYREARNGAIKQLKLEQPRTFREDSASKVIDRLSYKYIAKHYLDQDGELPQWIADRVNGVGPPS